MCRKPDNLYIYNKYVASYSLTNTELLKCQTNIYICSQFGWIMWLSKIFKAQLQNKYKLSVQKSSKINHL